MMAISAGLKSQTQEATSAHAVYRPRLLYQVAAGIVCAFSLLSATLMTVIFVSVGGVGLGLIVLLLYYSLIAMFWMAYQIVFTDSLLISAEGVQFQIMGQAGAVTWEQVERLERRTSGAYRLGGVVVNGMTVSRGVWYPFFGVFFAVDTILGRLGDFLPLGYFGVMPWQGSVLDEDRFKITPLGQDLLHYAPHLFTEH